MHAIFGKVVARPRAAHPPNFERRTSKFAFVELHKKATRRVAGDFLRHLVEAVPYKINIVLTDNGTHCTEPTGDSWTPDDVKAMRAEGALFRCHSFEAACADLDIEHRLTKPAHPSWTNGQLERMNRTIRDATVRRCHYDENAQFETHLVDFVTAYNFGRRLKTLKGLAPYEVICKRWAAEPHRFNIKQDWILSAGDQIEPDRRLISMAPRSLSV